MEIRTGKRNRSRGSDGGRYIDRDKDRLRRGPRQRAEDRDRGRREDRGQRERRRGTDI